MPYGWSDETLKTTIDQLQDTLAALQKLKTGAQVEGQGYGWSDETLPTTIDQLQDALAALQKLQKGEQVEGQLLRNG